MRTRRSQFSSDPMQSPIGARGETHQSVLLHEAIDELVIHEGDTVVDATLGGAGHARAIIEKLGKAGTFIGFDLDHDAIERAHAALLTSAARTILIENNFRHIKRELSLRGISTITKALFDLGWSSYQLDSRLRQGFGGQAGRGFSFSADEPLIMTYAKYSSQTAVTAATIVNTWAEESIADIIYGFGGERYSRRIAKAIVERRLRRPFDTSTDLAAIVKVAVPAVYRSGRIHPATRTFQALRIAVNDELGALKDSLTDVFDLIEDRGRIAIITFHSLEDRIVKQTFAMWEKEGKGIRTHKKPISPTRDEQARNPRSRSAKLRVFERHFHHEKETSKNK